MENLAFENNPSVQANDVEMGDATVDGNTMSLLDGNEESGTAANASNSSLLAATNNSHADGEDAEMNTEGNDLVAGTVIAQSGSSVHNIDDGNPEGTATDNDLFNSTKEVSRHEDDDDLDLDLSTVQAMDKAYLSPHRSVDESTSEVLNHEVHYQEGCKGTLDAQPLEQAPDENGHEEPQSVEMETEQDVGSDTFNSNMVWTGNDSANAKLLTRFLCNESGAFSKTHWCWRAAFKYPGDAACVKSVDCLNCCRFVGCFITALGA